MTNLFLLRCLGGWVTFAPEPASEGSAPGGDNNSPIGDAPADLGEGEQSDGSFSGAREEFATSPVTSAGPSLPPGATLAWRRIGHRELKEPLDAFVCPQKQEAQQGPGMIQE